MKTGWITGDWKPMVLQELQNQTTSWNETSISQESDFHKVFFLNAIFFYYFFVRKSMISDKGGGNALKNKTLKTT